MCHLPAAESQCYLHAVSLGEELAGCTHLRVEIVGVDIRRHPDLLYLNYLLLLRKNYPLLHQAMDAEDYRMHICSIDFPIIVKKHEFFINQKFSPLVMRTDGITKIGLFLINPSTSNHLESFIITQSEIRWRFDVEKGQYKRFNLRTSLSFKEKVILERIKKGMTNEEIASNLNLSVPTIKTHRMRIFKKLSVKTIAEALTVIGNDNLI